MTEEQRMLVEQNLSIVKTVLWQLKLYNQSIYGITYDDLLQEGSLALCKAAIWYQKENTASFRTYAEIVIRNHFINCFKKYYAISCKEKVTEEMAYESVYYFDESSLYVMEFIEKKRKNSSEATKRGFEAILLKMAGYHNHDIAKIYGVTSKSIWNWITRTAIKIKLDQDFKEISV